MGARPNLVKIAPIVESITRDGRISPTLVHTGQHYDAAMSDVFFGDLNLPKDIVSIGAGSGTHAEQTSRIMLALEALVRDLQPDIVVTVGDVNSTLAAALVAAKEGVPLAHVEAGLRSHDASMPEEVNRVLVDRLSDLLFTHSEDADCNLRAEGVAAPRIHRVGNVMIDTLRRLQTEWQGAGARAVGVLPDQFGVVTLHRPSNVDSATNLGRIMAALAVVARDLPLIFPVHPRTRAQLGDRHWPGINLVGPLGYLPFLDLVEHARVVLTDSGGVQEETTVLGVPCLTLRDNTERPVTLTVGTNRLIGTDPAAIPRAFQAALGAPPLVRTIPELWDGHTADRIVAVLGRWLDGSRALRLSDHAG